MHAWLITTAEPIPSDGVRPMRFMSLADQLLSQGHSVTLWTTTFFHHTRAQRFPVDTCYEAAPRYSVVVLRATGYQKNVSLRRFLAHRDFAHRLREEIPRLPRPDVILTSLPPLDTVAAVVDYGRHAGVPVVVDVIDPWPDAFLSLVPARTRPAVRPLLAPMYRQARRIFGQCSGVTALSSTYLKWAEHMAGHTFAHEAVFYPGVDIATFDRTVDDAGGYRRDGKGKTCFVYAGALGNAYDVETVIGCARMLAAEGFDQAEFLIAGNGPKADKLKAMADGLTNARLLGWLNGRDLAALFARSHVGLACYVHHATQTITYKLFDYLTAGLPILCSLPGEMSELIEREQVGMAYPPEDPAALASIVRKLCKDPQRIEAMSAAARRLAEERGNSARVYRQMVEFLEQVEKARYTVSP